MKNLKNFMRVLKTSPVFNGFDNAEDVFSQFNENVRPNIKIVCAIYENDEYYEADALVFYYNTKTRKYYETYGSHCSCYRLEDQWTWDEEIVFEELEKRLKISSYGVLSTFRNLFNAYLTNDRDS